MRHPELKLFAGAYLLYNVERWITAGDMRWSTSTGMRRGSTGRCATPCCSPG
jgi:hypothetical protein